MDAWECVCGGRDPGCGNCGGSGLIEVRDWCAACAERNGAGCRQVALGLSSRMRERGGAWVSVCMGEQRVHRCPRYSGPETEAA
jgi:hypothetical protein